MTDAIKLGMHIQRVEPWMAALAAQQGHPWIKWVNPPEGGPNPAPGVPNHCVRFWHDPEQPRYIAGGEAGGRQYILDTLPRIRRVPWATCIELANEPDVNSNDGLRNLNLYSLGAMREAERHGLKLCILNLAQGNPGATPNAPEGPRASERWKLAQLEPCVRHAAQNGHWVGLHTYWLPRAGIDPLSRWHSLGRAEWNVEQWFEMGVPRTLRVLINENGVDGLIQNRTSGWRNESTLAEYARDVGVYEARARQLPWLESHMLFTVGFEPPWESYDHGEHDMRAIFAALPAPVAQPQPAPVVPAPIPRPIVSPAIMIPPIFGAEGVTYRTPPNAPQMFSSPRAMGIAAPDNKLRLFLVLHSTDGPKAAAFGWFASSANTTRASAHDVVGFDGIVHRCVPYSRTAHHAGSASARLPGVPVGSTGRVSNTNHASIGIELESGKAPAPAGYTEVQLAAAAKHMAALARTLGIPRERWVTHTQVDPIRKPTCPRDLDVAAFWDRVERALDPKAIDEKALAEWIAHYVWPVNPDAALARYALAQGWRARSDEHDWRGVRAQVWESAGGAQRFVVWARASDWSDVRHFEMRG